MCCFTKFNLEKNLVANDFELFNKVCYSIVCAFLLCVFPHLFNLYNFAGDHFD